MPAEQIQATLVALDIEGYSQPDRDDQIREELLHTLNQVFAKALAAMGINDTAWSTTDIGDGLLAVFKDTPTALVLQALLKFLPDELASHNRTKIRIARIRARGVVHAGHIMLKAEKPWGEEVILACRLLDADALRSRLRLAPGDLQVGVSDYVYQSVVRHRVAGLDPDEFEALEVQVKEFHGRLWIPRLTGQRSAGTHSPAPTHAAATDEPAAAPPRPSLPTTPALGEEDLRSALVRLEDLPANWWLCRDEEVRELQGLANALCGDRLTADSRLTVEATFTGWPSGAYFNLVRWTSFQLTSSYHLSALVSLLPDHRDAARFMEQLGRRSRRSRWEVDTQPGSFELLEHEELPVAGQSLRFLLERRHVSSHSSYDFAVVRHEDLVAVLLQRGDVLPIDRRLVPELVRVVGQRLAALPRGDAAT